MIISNSDAESTFMRSLVRPPFLFSIKLQLPGRLSHDPRMFFWKFQLNVASGEIGTTVFFITSTADHSHTNIFISKFSTLKFRYFYYILYIELVH